MKVDNSVRFVTNKASVSSNESLQTTDMKKTQRQKHNLKHCDWEKI